MIIIDSRVIPGPIRTVDSAFVIEEIDNADTVDVAAGQAESGSIDAGLAVHVAQITGKS